MKKPRISRKVQRITKQTVVIGGTGAMSALLVDTVLSRLMPNSPTLMMISRVAAGVGLAVGADHLGASEEVSEGIAAGPILVTVIDGATRLIGRNNVRPPLAGSVQQLGDSWSPQIGL